jgi:hypothetical protein
VSTYHSLFSILVHYHIQVPSKRCRRCPFFPFSAFLIDAWLSLDTSTCQFATAGR